MAHKLHAFVAENSATTGTGPLTLSGALTAHRRYNSVLSVGDTTEVAVRHASNGSWAHCLATYSAADEITLTITVESSTGSPISWASGGVVVVLTPLASRLLSIDGKASLGANTDITSLGGLTGTISSPTSIQFGDGSAVTLAAGQQWYNPTTGSWNLGMGGGNITQQIGEEFFVYGKASAAISGSTLLQAIYRTGAVGASGVVTFGPTTSGLTDANRIIGVATENIALNGFGRVTSSGVVRGINTTGSTYGETWVDDDIIWYNPVTGGLTNVKPVAPNLKTSIGSIITASAGAGSIQVKISASSELGATDKNVQLTSVVDNNLLQYYAAGGYWRNVPGDFLDTADIGVTVQAYLGFTPYNSTNPAGYTTNTGTVTSVAALTINSTGTDVSSSVANGTTTPVITLSMPTASASARGLLSSTDWSTFNGKQAALGFTPYNSTNPAGYTTNTGTVTSVSVVNTNGFSGSVATATTTPAITITTTVTGVLKGNGTAISAATAETDYVTPSGTGTLTNKTLTNPTFIGTLSEDVYAITGTAPVIEPDNGSIQTWTLTGASTPTDGFSTGQAVTLMIDDGSAYTITWPTMTWQVTGGTPPTLAATGYTTVVLWKVGSTLYGKY